MTAQFEENKFTASLSFQTIYLMVVSVYYLVLMIFESHIFSIWLWIWQKNVVLWSERVKTLPVFKHLAAWYKPSRGAASEERSRTATTLMTSDDEPIYRHESQVQLISRSWLSHAIWEIMLAPSVLCPSRFGICGSMKRKLIKTV